MRKEHTVGFSKFDLDIPKLIDSPSFMPLRTLLSLTLCNLKQNLLIAVTLSLHTLLSSPSAELLHITTYSSLTDHSISFFFLGQIFPHTTIGD
jgi:hypothetical protein